ncbi:MAG TPA: ATP-binding protein [Erysipelotrichaceae bacterium]|nr:ATP-binding protein [Erysipelotrichaceae bacterium]
MILDKTKYMPRVIDKAVKKHLQIFGAVCIEGPKWCGKTWTSSYHSNSEFFVADPTNNFQNRELANISPDMVLEGETPRLIDEWQEVPAIWDAIRYEVDKRALKGQFILTGSSTPITKGILHSGAGRISKLRMRTMSLYESGDSLGQFSLEDLCNDNITPSITGDVDLKNLVEYILRGGFPSSINTPIENSYLLAESYIDAILDDAQRVEGKKYDKHKMLLLLRSLARNESTTVTNRTLAKDIKEVDDETIDTDTIATYLDVFDRMFLLDNQLPFSTNIRSSVRVKQSEKRHFCDTSLVCALLKLTPEKLINDLNTLGFLFESLCIRDLKIYSESFGATLYHYQGYDNKEIDAVIELQNGNWCAFEIKLGANKIDEAASSLLSIHNSISKAGGIPPSVMCVICGMSNAGYKRSDGVYVVPITALKN